MALQTSRYRFFEKNAVKALRFLKCKSVAFLAKEWKPVHMRKKENHIQIADAPDESALILAAIVESSDDAIISKRLDGTVTSWNTGAERLFGYKAPEMIGRSILAIIPQDRRHEEDLIIKKLQNGERIEHFETLRRRKDGSLIPISVTISPIKRPDGTIVGASKIARDISGRKKAEELERKQAKRLEILQRLSAVTNADLDLDRIIQTVTDEATALSGAKFGAFFNNRMADDGKTYTLYALSGVSREAFECFEIPRIAPLLFPIFAEPNIMRSTDIREGTDKDKSVSHKETPQGHPSIASYLAVPMKSASGEVLGGFFFGHEEPGKFSTDTESLIRGIAAQAAMAIDNARLHDAAMAEIDRRKDAEAAKDLLLRELKHRIRNTMAVIQALASQTLRQSSEEEREGFLQRIRALSSAHDLLTQADWKSISLTLLTQRALKPFHDAEDDRITATGPDVTLSSAQALALTLSLHELGTNALKYGALSNDRGNITIRWYFPDPDNRGHLRLCWQEQNGPEVTPPARQGFGSRMIKRALSSKYGTAKFDYLPEGLLVTIEMELDNDPVATSISKY